MASIEQIDAIISSGEASLIGKRIITFWCTLWFYDYFLTLGDEIEWVWSGRKSWAFALFILNRYWPLWYLLWTFVSYWCPEFTKPLCNKTAWFVVLYCAFTILFAEIVIALRIFAITRKNRWTVASCFSLIASAQFVFGIYSMVFFSSRPVPTLSDIPLEVFQVCQFQRWRTGEIVFTTFSLIYDSTAFFVVIYSSRDWRSVPRASGAPSLLENIIQGATVYFFVIFTCNIVVIFVVLLTSDVNRLAPLAATVVLTPVMATRLAISLRKTANGSNSPSSVGSATEVSSIRFAHRTFGGTELGVMNAALGGVLPRGGVDLP